MVNTLAGGRSRCGRLQTTLQALESATVTAPPSAVEAAAAGKTDAMAVLIVLGLSSPSFTTCGRATARSSIETKPKVRIGDGRRQDYSGPHADHSVSVHSAYSCVRR
jgi:hypothetical protein